MTSDDEVRHREQARVSALKKGLEAFGALHGLTERDRGSHWCGHHLLGGRPAPRHSCHRSGDRQIRWWDHTHGFGQGRQPTVILGWPYASHDTLVPLVRTYAEELGLEWQVGRPDGPLSFYFFGATTPWLLARPGVDVSAMFAATSPGLEEALSFARGYAASRTDLQAREATRTASGG